MTPNIRQRIVDIHNEYRSQLARGLVRSGKPGKANLHTATNMYKMRYDMTLEEEAQAYVDSCPLAGSALSTRRQSGENFEVNPSPTISCLSAVEN
ncbi:SCP-like protein, partial [Ancylostoma duodenale]